MEILRLTAQDFKDGKYSKGELEFEGHIEISSDLGWLTFTRLKASGYIFAGRGTSIKAGTSIEAKSTINVSLRIFAGLISHRLPTTSEQIISCSRLESGIVAYGTLIETKAK